jgi:2-keto-4-pentenoate hydratase/2-oxohepta-3-ene-1,7-dioic acid hydratase in catechol pathway
MYRDHCHVAIVDGDVARLLGRPGHELPPDMNVLIAENQAVGNAPLGRLMRESTTAAPLSDVRLLPPLPHPEKIVCVGRNYADHAAEMGSRVDQLPVIFNKFPTAICGPGDAIPVPSISHSVDFEAELVVVIGKSARHISPDAARQHVFGYCCGNDITARDWQKQVPGGQWLLGKSFDGFAPIGPWLVTADAIDPDRQEISLLRNGELMQRDHTSRLVFGIDFLISHLSRFCTLRPGDLLFTGTPAGVGAGRQPPLFLQPGDRTEVRISGIGSLQNSFVAEETG